MYLKKIDDIIHTSGVFDKRWVTSEILFTNLETMFGDQAFYWESNHFSQCHVQNWIFSVDSSKRYQLRLTVVKWLFLDIDGLVQDCSNSIANALELLQSWIKPLIMMVWKQALHLSNIFHNTGGYVWCQVPKFNNFLWIMQYTRKIIVNWRNTFFQKIASFLISIIWKRWFKFLILYIYILVMTSQWTVQCWWCDN